jgi:hypothetical protein
MAGWLAALFTTEHGWLGMVKILNTNKNNYQ